MNRASAGILGIAIVLGLLVGPASRHASDGAPVMTSRAWTSAEAASKAPAKQEKALDDCEIKPGTFKFDLISAIQAEYSRGERFEKGCPEDFQIDAVRAPLTHVLFAIVPDPVHTNLPLFFDQQMDALQQGVLDSGWTFEKALMPWDNQPHPEPSDFRVRKEQKLFEAEQESQPGIMLFRRNTQVDARSQPSPDKTGAEPNKNAPAEQKQEKSETNQSGSPPKQGARERLLVFVIGESPAGGINKSQFRNALYLINKLFTLLPSQSRLDLPIMGPAFSGSLHSLAGVLCCRDSAAVFPLGKISVLSGTITSKSSMDAFEKESGLCVETLQENDEYAVRLFLRFAGNVWGYEPERIAILSEDETAYGTRGLGQTGAKPEKEIPAGTSTPCEQQQAANVKTNDQQPVTGAQEENPTDKGILDGAKEKKALHLYFPREISQLRSAYQRAIEGHSRNSKVPRITLPLDLDSNATDEDTVRQYSGKQLPLSQEAVLLGIVGELQAHGSEIILLRATNALDQLFLSRYLRQAYPNARIIVVSADLLFAREIEDARLHGVMALTTYSLTAAADHEFQNETETPIHSDRVFPNTDAVGTFNATKLLLARTGLGLEQAGCKDSGCVHLFQYGWPEFSNPKVSVGRPPVHLTVLGHGGFWDVAILPTTATQAAKEDQTPQRNGIAHSSLPRVQSNDSSVNQENLEKHMPRIWYVLWLLAIGISLAYAYFIWFPSIRSSSQAVAQLAPPLNDSRRNLFVVTAWLHFGILLAVGWPYKYLFRHGAMEVIEMIGLGLTMAIISLIGIADLNRRTCYRQSQILTWGCVVMGAVFLIALQPDYFHYMSVFRSVHLASGLSELLSVLLLLASGLWGAWYALSGSSLLDLRCTILPHLNMGPQPLSKGQSFYMRSLRPIFHDDHERLRKLLHADYIDKRPLLLGGFVALPIYLYTRARPLHTLEPSKHEYLLAGLILCLFLIILIEVFRIYGIWIELRRILIALDSTPLRSAFRQLKGFTWSPLWQLGGGHLGDFRRLISRQVEVLHCVFALKTPLVADLEEEFNTQADATLEAFERLIGIEQPEARQDASRASSDKTTDKSSERTSATTDMASARAATGAADGKVPTKAPTAGDRQSSIPRLPERLQKEIDLITKFNQLQQEFAKAGAHSLAFAITQWESATTVPEIETVSASSKPIGNSTGQSTVQPEPAHDTMRHNVEHFLALLYTNFIAIVLMRIRALIIGVGGMYVFFVLALTTYPFQPEVEIRFFLAILLLFIVGVVGLVYAQIHRDSTLSHITSSEPGELGTVFWVRIGSFIALPLFSLLASGYPEIGNVIYSWLEPALHALQ